MPVLKLAQEEQPTILLYFTDLYAEHIPQTDEALYPFETMWICYSKHTPQGYGETIYYEPERS